MFKRKLLLADDSITIQKVVNLTFADEGVEVIAAIDGDAAMKKFVECAPDLVMVDVNMPGVDGYRICEIIKQDAETKHIPVILLVGSFEPFDEAEAKRVGADDFLTKPFQSIRQLVNKVSGLLGDKKVEEDFSPLIENPSNSVVKDLHSTTDTLSADEIESADASIERFGGAMTDDEMIQTAQLDQAEEKFSGYQSEPVDESLSEEFARTYLEPPLDSDKSPVEPKIRSEDSAETHRFSNSEIENITAISDATVEKRTTSASNFKDFDALEFPQLTQKAVADQIVLQSGSGIYNETPSEIDEPQTELVEEQLENNKKTLPSENFSPELVEALADKVVEKLSDRFVEKIVREVVAQLKEKK